jgi:cardiolipin synthase
MGKTVKKLSKRKQKAIERTLANNRSYKLYLYNRFWIYLLLVLAQIVCGIFLLWLLAYDSVAVFGIQITVSVLAVLFVLYLLSKEGNSSSKITWILLILVFPVFGVPVYLVYGEGRATKRIDKKVQAAKLENNQQEQSILPKQERYFSDERTDSVCKFLETRAKYPVYTDGSVDYYKSGEEMFPVMLE